MGAYRFVNLKLILPSRVRIPDRVSPEVVQDFPPIGQTLGPWFLHILASTIYRHVDLVIGPRWAILAI